VEGLEAENVVRVGVLIGTCWTAYPLWLPFSGSEAVSRLSRSCAQELDSNSVA
jgi:hypothetical protein